MDEALKDEVQVLVDRLAATVGQSVAIDDPDGNIIAISRHYGDEDAYRVKLVLERRILPEYEEFFGPFVREIVQSGAHASVRVPPHASLGIVGRTGFAIGVQGRVLAILWFIDRGRELPRDTIREYCDVLGELLSRRYSQRPHVTAEETNDSLERILRGDPDLDEVALWLRNAGTQFLVLVCGVRRDVLRSETAATAALRAEIRPILRRLPQLLPGDELSLACMTTLDGLHIAVYGGQFGSDRETDAVRARVSIRASTELAKISPEITGSVAGWGELHLLRNLYAEAALAAFITAAVDRSTTISEALSSLALSAAVAPAAASTATGSMAVLQELLQSDGGFAFETLEAMILGDGTQAAVLQELQLHRTTLRYRISQIEERTGLQLSAPADMFLATLAWLRVALQRSRLSPLASLR